ncbi:hypothetical protein JCM11641_002409 [Rhodosporidiobolus odoratus]
MTFSQPPLPSVSNYPTTCPYEAEIETAHQRFLDELNSSPESWQDLGEGHNGCHLSKKVDETHSNPLPLCRGESVVEGVTPDAFLAGVVQLPGMRTLWDPRTEVGYMMERYDRDTVLFYALTKGVRLLASPRDLIGIQRDYDEADDWRTIIQTSVEHPSYPEQSKATRATLKLSGWSFRQEGNDTRVVYILDVLLNGRIPNKIVSMASSESPLCAGRARDVYYQHGHAPYVQRSPASGDLSLIYQLETITPLPHPEYRCSITTGSTTGETFNIVYDTVRMYKNGASVQLEGNGVSAEDNGQGIVKVTTTAAGEVVTIVLTSV